MLGAVRTTIKLRGWKAVAVLLAFAGFVLFNRYASRRTLDSDAVEAIKPWIVSAYCRPALAKLEARPLDQLTPAERQALSDNLLRAQKVEIKSIAARGSGDSIICKVEVLVDGRVPPDGRTVRFYRMSYSHLLGWIYKQESNALMWHLTLW